MENEMKELESRLDTNTLNYLKMRYGNTSEKYLEMLRIETNLDEKYKKIDGWLILVGIGLFLNLIICGYSIYTYAPYFVGSNLSVLLDKTSSIYHPLLFPTVLFESIFQISFFVYLFFLIYNFFAKKIVFPKMYIIFLVSTIIFGIIDFILVSSIPSLNTSHSASLPNILVSCIWIAYFRMSERVQSTFRY